MRSKQDMINRMDIQELSFKEVKKIRLRDFFDERGFFRETFNRSAYVQAGMTDHFVQDNHSCSKQGVLRGMHFQQFPGQVKLVTVIAGTIFDVVVDVRLDSPTFGRWEGVYLDAALSEQLYIPVGFAHGFCVVSREAHVCYKVSTPYDPAQERSFAYNDPAVSIKWPIDKPVLSEKDAKAPHLKELVR